MPQERTIVMKTETIADIVADIRARNQGCPLDAEGSHCTVEDILFLADRIEAAHESEVVAAATRAATCAIKYTEERVMRDVAERETVDIDGRAIYGEVRESVTDCNHLNAAKLREALNDIVGIAKIALNVNCVGNSNNSHLWNIIDKCKSALAEPLRNCDVGTPMEQNKRLESFCAKHFRYANDNPCAKCPIKDDSLPCVYRFLQMPYEAKEGENDGQ